MSLYQSFVVKGELCIKAELLIYGSSDVHNLWVVTQRDTHKQHK